MKLNELLETRAWPYTPKKPAPGANHRLNGDEATKLKKAVLKMTGGSVTLFDTNDEAQAIEINLSKAHDPQLTSAVAKQLVKKIVNDMGYDFELKEAGVRVSANGANRWARVVFWAKTKLDEAVAAKPTQKELDDRATYEDPDFQGPLDDGQVYVAKNQKDAFIAYIMARLREMEVNPKHVNVHWSSARQATAFPPAGIRFVVMNKKSEVYAGTEVAETFPAVAKGLVKNAFRDVLDFKVKVEREDIVSEYANGLRYLDYKAEWA